MLSSTTVFNIDSNNKYFQISILDYGLCDTEDLQKEKKTF